MDNVDTIKRQIEVARRLRPADLLLKGGKVVNVLTGKVYQTNVAICEDRITGVGDYYQEGIEDFDAGGLYIIPGLIDAHVHIESSLLTPIEFARAVLPHGTTTVICDPHEIANVMGIEGIRYLLDTSKNIPLSLFVTAPSCVPATHLETSGSTISSAEIEELFRWDRVIGLGEVMNVQEVLKGNIKVLEKILIAKQRSYPIDGHSPALSRENLNAYIGVGICSDHETTSKEEAAEKLRLGMYLMIREGSAARNLEELLPVVTPMTESRCMFVSDDRQPKDLLAEGHMDHILRKGVRLGLDPIVALRMATVNPARAFMRRDTGAIAPGYRADIVLVNDLEGFVVRSVIKDGKIVVRDEEIVINVPQGIIQDRTPKKMCIKDFSLDRFKIRIRGNRVRIIELITGQLYTRQVIEDVSVNSDGEVMADPKRDLLKIAVIERHSATGNIGLGFVKGFGLKRGALGSSVSHDSHNIIVIGDNDRDMYLAAKKIIETGGGHVVASGGQVLGSLPLPIAGLLSDKSLEEVVGAEERLLAAARGLGAKSSAPFIKMSFLALPVIPEIKITDKGLVDVNRFELIDIEP